jgi:hypothetical protein
MATDQLQRPTRDIQRPPARLDISPDHDPLVIRGEHIAKDAKLLAAARAPLEQAKAMRTTINELIGTTANRAELARAAAARAESVTKSFDAAVPALTARRDAVEASITKMFEPQCSAAGEIRQHFKSAPEGYAAAAKLIESGDLRSVRAILGAPAYLSGLSQEQFATLKSHARLKFAPNEAGLSADLERAITTLNRVGSAVVAQVAGAIHTWGAADRDAVAIKKALGS